DSGDQLFAARKPGGGAVLQSDTAGKGRLSGRASGLPGSCGTPGAAGCGAWTVRTGQPGDGFAGCRLEAERINGLVSIRFGGPAAGSWMAGARLSDAGESSGHDRAAGGHSQWIYLRLGGYVGE